MTNRDTARVLEEIADLLEIKGESPFKVRAYQRAAQAIEGLSEQLSDMRGKTPFTDIPGIGASIARKIEELLDTGTCAFHQELLAEFPASLTALLGIPEIGPRKAQILHDQLGITSVDELEEAARAGRLRDLKGFGAKTEANILRGIERLRVHKARLPLAEAHPLAMEVVESLVLAAPVERIEPAGSIRRMRDTIGDIDILVTSSEPEEVMSAFVSLPVVHQVVARGGTKSSVVSASDAQIDVRVVEPESFGAALQYFTGSKEHNVRLRESAVRRGLRLSEYGVFEVKTDRRVAGATEEEVYAALDLPLIPPELREDRGEIAAAQRGELPQLVTVEDIKGDLHVHTKRTDGHHTIEEMAEAAKGAGYKYIAICDHSKSVGMAGGLFDDALLEHVEEIRAASKRIRGLTILAGTECDIRRDGSLDYPDDVLAQLDFVIAAVHSGFKMDADSMTSRIIDAMKNPYVDALAHPTGRIIGRRDPYEVDVERLLAAAAELGVAMEINAYPDRLDLRDIHARRAKELGVKIIINTDAHDCDHLRLITYGVATARRGWLEPEDVLNTLPLAALRKQLRRNRTRAA
ncbi:MAG: DNA polymerase/3'-5' exonuclease PolX [Armatimonadota bacterium]|nr:MAG: DNA polymerase/3'-5' exonuclease PolX [Armatimonadota bacterium]